jgi:CHAD domain-containing protein
MRIACKHLRYASEAFELTYGKAAQRFAGGAEKLQEILGNEHDAVSAGAQLRAAAIRPAAGSMAGDLAARCDHAARRLRSKWRGSWKKLRHRRFWT